MQAQDIVAQGWHRIVHFEDTASGLNAIVAVHDATLGPGCGGTRVFPYASFEAGLADVKNLSRGMTYKNALGGIPFGGGKAVVFADPAKDKSREMMLALGRAIQSLEGLYYTAEDSGMSEEDILAVREVTPYAAGMQANGVGGNPSPFTARGVWRGIQAATKFHLGRDTLKDARVSILGVGAVGMALAEHLHQEGAILTVADIHEASVQEAVQRFGARAATPEKIIDIPSDVFAPCALGGAINVDMVDQLKTSIVAGAANNQLSTPDMGTKLMKKNILYAPDYVINAAGVISVGLEILGTWTPDALNQRIDRIGDTLMTIFERARAEHRPTHEIADAMAEEVIAAGRANNVMAG